MIGQQIAPLLVHDVDPPSSKDSAGFGIANDGQTYVIKSQAQHQLLPATEAFCEALAVACQLPATTGAWLEVRGVSCYGSRWEGGLTQPMKAATYLEIEGRKRAWQRCTNPGVASAAFVFDLFVFNYDRHHNNWTFQNQNGNLTARVFDFSRAWWVCARDLANLPLPSTMKALPVDNERTCAAYRLVRSWTGESALAAQNVLDLLRRIPPQWVQQRLDQLPPGWIDSVTAQATVAWWASAARVARIEDIERGMKNATLL